MNTFESIIGWQFMQEPMWRWFLFVGAFTAITIAWGGILSIAH